MPTRRLDVGKGHYQLGRSSLRSIGTELNLIHLLIFICLSFDVESVTGAINF